MAAPPVVGCSLDSRGVDVMHCMNVEHYEIEHAEHENDAGTLCSQSPLQTRRATCLVRGLDAQACYVISVHRTWLPLALSSTSILGGGGLTKVVARYLRNRFFGVLLPQVREPSN